MPSPAWPFHTERLVLRPFAADDLDSLHAIHSDEGVARWLYNEPRSLEETRELLANKVGGASAGRLEPRNIGSARVLEKLGMRREGLLVENEWVKGEWQSELVYAILDREWRDASAGGDGGNGRY